MRTSFHTAHLLTLVIYTIFRLFSPFKATLYIFLSHQIISTSFPIWSRIVALTFSKKKSNRNLVKRTACNQMYNHILFSPHFSLLYLPPEYDLLWAKMNFPELLQVVKSILMRILCFPSVLIIKQPFGGAHKCCATYLPLWSDYWYLVLVSVASELFKFLSSLVLG